MQKGFSTTKESNPPLVEFQGAGSVTSKQSGVWYNSILGTMNFQTKSNPTCNFQDIRRLPTRGLAHFYQAIFLEIRFGITDEKFLWPSLEVTKNISCDGLFFANSNGSEVVVKIAFTDRR